MCFALSTHFSLNKTLGKQSKIWKSFPRKIPYLVMQKASIYFYVIVPLLPRSKCIFSWKHEAIVVVITVVVCIIIFLLWKNRKSFSVEKERNESNPDTRHSSAVAVGRASPHQLLQSSSDEDEDSGCVCSYKLALRATRSFRSRSSRAPERVCMQ